MKMKLTRFFTAIVATILFSSAFAGPLTGDVVDVSVIRTDPSNYYGTGRILGYGLDSPFQVVDGITDRKQYSSVFTIDIDGDAFHIRFIDSGGWQEGTVLRLSGLDFAPGSGVTPDGLLVQTNFNGHTLLFGRDNIDIGLGGTRFDSNTYLRGVFRSAQVPEPPTTVLFALALAALMLSRETRPKGQSEACSCPWPKRCTNDRALSSTARRRKSTVIRQPSDRPATM